MAVIVKFSGVKPPDFTSLCESSISALIAKSSFAIAILIISSAIGSDVLKGI